MAGEVTEPWKIDLVQEVIGISGADSQSHSSIAVVIQASVDRIANFAESFSCWVAAQDVWRTAPMKYLVKIRGSDKRAVLQHFMKTLQRAVVARSCILARSTAATGAFKSPLTETILANCKSSDLHTFLVQFEIQIGEDRGAAAAVFVPLLSDLVERLRDLTPVLPATYPVVSNGLSAEEITFLTHQIHRPTGEALVQRQRELLDALLDAPEDTPAAALTADGEHTNPTTPTAVNPSVLDRTLSSDASAFATRSSTRGFVSWITGCSRYQAALEALQSVLGLKCAQSCLLALANFYQPLYHRSLARSESTGSSSTVAQDTGADLEELTVLGRMFLVGPTRSDFTIGTDDFVKRLVLDRVGRLGPVLFADPAEDQPVAAPLQRLRQRWSQFVAADRETSNRVVGLLLPLLKRVLTGPAKEAVLGWISDVCAANRGRTTTQFQRGLGNDSTLTSTGALFTLCRTMLKLCDPFLDPASAGFAKIDLQYLFPVSLGGAGRLSGTHENPLARDADDDASNSSWLDQRNLSRVNHFQQRQRHFAGRDGSSPAAAAFSEGAPPKRFGTISEFFFLASRLLHVSILADSRRLRASAQLLERMGAQRAELEAAIYQAHTARHSALQRLLEQQQELLQLYVHIGNASANRSESFAGQTPVQLTS